MKFNELRDIHTHHPNRNDALLSLSPEKAMAGYSLPFSLELHPWQASPALIEQFRQAAETLQSAPNLLAIGECGLDNKCGTSLPLQTEAFREALSAARRLQLPVIIHCVGYWAEMMQSVREVLGPSYPHPIIIHGFRKGPQLAQQLLKAGFSISLGQHYNAAVRTLIPEDRLYFETDENPILHL
ncbi:MAG: TatD family hydrolase [Bacteroidales bacterium]|nr:TatD family hydrolase [Bacteroidales bacterium]